MLVRAYTALVLLCTAACSGSTVERKPSPARAKVVVDAAVEPIGEAVIDGEIIDSQTSTA